MEFRQKIYIIDNGPDVYKMTLESDQLREVVPRSFLIVPETDLPRKKQGAIDVRAFRMYRG